MESSLCTNEQNKGFPGLSYKTGVIYPQASNVTFPELGSEQDHVDSARNYQLTQHKSGEQLGLFFTRPVHLYDLSWDQSFSDITLKPWYEWFVNKRISNRIANYSGFRGNLHLKFTVIGNPFYFGRMQISYLPMAGRLQSIEDENYGTDQFGIAMIRSQRQVINLDPSISSGGEMVLPFVCDTDYMPISTATEDLLLEFGTVYLDDLTQLQNVNLALGATPPLVTIRIYAWMDNMEVLGNTAFTQVVVPQSNQAVVEDWEQKQANGGVISDTLSSIGGVCDVLSTIPTIAPYAAPAAIVANTAADIAQKLGFSKPLNMTVTDKMVPRPFVGETYVVGGDNAVKLALTPHQITTVDPLVLGAECDELSFSYICGKKSLASKLAWSLSDPAEHLIARYPVTPMINYPSVEGGKPMYYTTAIGGIANLFELWAGTMHFTFELVSTCFHRGRILVVYDPLGSRVNAEENVQYAAVVDISEARAFTVSVGFNSIFGMLPTGDLTTFNNANVTAAQGLPNHNGHITLYVANALTVPNYVSGTSPESIDILSYVSGGDDLSFAFPRTITNHDGESIHFEPNSNPAAMMDEQLMKCCDKDMSYKALDVSVKDVSEYGAVYKGEDIHSLRALVKRYVHYYSTHSIATTSTQLVQWQHGPYPALPGAPINSGEPTLGNDPLVNYVGFTVLAYVKAAFMTYRGSMRWKFLSMTPSTFSPPSSISDHGVLTVLRAYTDGPGLLNYFNEDYTLTTAGGSQVYSQMFASMQSGSSITTTHINDTLEFEMPYQSNRKFKMGRSNDGATIALTTAQQVFSIVAPSTSLPSYFSLLVAAGEDFNAQHFVGWPPYRLTKYP